jgi:hypothetical protein
LSFSLLQIGPEVPLAPTKDVRGPPEERGKKKKGSMGYHAAAD